SENNASAHQQDEFSEISKEMDGLFFFIEKHRIYLSEDIWIKLDKVVSDLRRNIVAAGIFGRIENPNEQTLIQSQSAFTKGYADFENEIPFALRALEK